MWPFSAKSPTEEKIKAWADHGKIKPLVKVIESDADVSVRIAAMRALADMDTRSLNDHVRNVLSQQFSSSDLTMRKAALEASARNPDPATAERLFGAIEKAGESARIAAYRKLTEYLRQTRELLVQLSHETGDEPPDVNFGQAASAIKEMGAAAGGDSSASHNLLMRSIRGDKAATWAYSQSEKLRRTKAIETIGLALIAHVEGDGSYDVLLKTLDDIHLGEPGDYQVRFQKLERVVNALREGQGEIREQAVAAVLAILAGQSVNAAGAGRET